MAAYCPDVQDIVWLDFSEATTGNEQSGRRPALVLSPRAFNELTGRCLACPITRHDRNWNLHVAIDHETVQGVIQVDQLRSLSWERRGSRLLCQATDAVFNEVLGKLKALLSL